MGFYELYLNGNKVSDHVLDPGITDYRKTVLYSTYDVASLLKKGENVMVLWWETVHGIYEKLREDGAGTALRFLLVTRLYGYS